MKTIVHWLDQYGLRSTPRNQRIWLTASLIIAMLYGILFWRLAFEHPYSIQDDARQHVFWMWRYVDPSLFPNDIIADYFQSVAPVGYKVLYRLGAILGIHPLIFHKLLPPIIGLAGTVYTFYLALAIIPVPLVAFINTLILNQSLWMWDELASGTPKAFSVLLILALLFYISERKLWGCVVVIGLQGLFYPHLVFISVLLLALRTVWPHSDRRSSLRFLIIGSIVATLVLLPYVLTTSPYGPVVTLEQAKTMAEFQPGGRNAFFYDAWSRYWLFSGRSGLLPPSVPTTICLSLFFPLILWLKLPLLKKVTRHGALITQLGLASIILFFLSHSVLFRLHLPSRYSRHSLKVIVALAAAMVIVTLLDAGLRRLSRQPQQLWRQTIALAMVAGTTLITVGYPLLLDSFLNSVYIDSDRTALYEYIQEQPKDIRIASLAHESENIPAFTGRSVMISRGHSLAYHQGYYNQIRSRILDLITAQYSPELSVLKSIITDYGIDFWLIDEQSFNPEAMPGMWLRQFETAWTTAINQMQQQPSALQQLTPTCTVVSDQGKTLIATACVLDAQE
ncbi:hypothetical protein [Leptothoe spongobia]|uniref:Uncharacterized protein n=1 Tax=Leptothoe spongobia TAU-MAC 1115 TaxID=1967444 RepID=A0A947DDS6_9CYAN|nr:hypothetical protein [Leptothoe spongobia]MBT9315136.1 hypothetical protein [Leptothoe spongobia TAU-MAC 1115]